MLELRARREGVLADGGARSVGEPRRLVHVDVVIVVEGCEWLLGLWLLLESVLLWLRLLELAKLGERCGRGRKLARSCGAGLELVEGCALAVGCRELRLLRLLRPLEAKE